MENVSTGVGGRRSRGGERGGTAKCKLDEYTIWDISQGFLDESESGDS